MHWDKKDRKVFAIYWQSVEKGQNTFKGWTVKMVKALKYRYELSLIKMAVKLAPELEHKASSSRAQF